MRSASGERGHADTPARVGANHIHGYENHDSADQVSHASAADFRGNVDRSLSWAAESLVDDDVADTVAFFGLNCREQFLAIEELRTLARLAIDLAGVDPGVFLDLATQGLRGWLTTPVA